jgi:hypothetical protein
MSDKALDVKAINRAQKLAMLDCGCLVPVTGWFSKEGEDCAPDDAIVCVCGDDSHGWFLVDLAAFEIVTVH